MAINLETPPELMAIVTLPTECYPEVVSALSATSGFVSMTRDAAEITLILAEAEWAKLEARFPESQFSGGRRLIRFDTVLDFSVVGFLAEVARVLAESAISILAISTWRTDAILVSEAAFDRAVSIISGSERLAAIAGRRQTSGLSREDRDTDQGRPCGEGGQSDDGHQPAYLSDDDLQCRNG